MTIKKIYLAGPFLNEQQVSEQKKLYDFLTHVGYDVQSAYKSGINLGIAYQTLFQKIKDTKLISETVYYLNIATASHDIWMDLGFGDITVANFMPLSNPEQNICFYNEDSGTVVETIYASAFNHPIVIWNSVESRLIPEINSFDYNGFVNPMIYLINNRFNISSSNVQKDNYCVNQLWLLEERLKEIISKGLNPQKKKFPEFLQKKIDLGYYISQIISHYTNGDTTFQELSINLDLIFQLASFTKRYGKTHFNIIPWNEYDFAKSWTKENFDS